MENCLRSDGNLLASHREFGALPRGYAYELSRNIARPLVAGEQAPAAAICGSHLAGVNRWPRERCEPASMDVREGSHEDSGCHSWSAAPVASREERIV